VGCFWIGNQKVVLFPTFRKNGWEVAASALNQLMSVHFSLGKLGF
jgi:hypothetical protein